MLCKGNMGVEPPCHFIRVIGAIAMHHDDGALCGELAVGEQTRDEPAAQEQMIFSTGEGDSAVLHAKGSRCGVDRFLRGVDELVGDVQGKGNVGSSHQRGENQKRCYKPAHSPGSEEPCVHRDDLLVCRYPLCLVLMLAILSVL